MPKIGEILELNRCPHCQVDKPNLKRNHSFYTTRHDSSYQRLWAIYVCARCGGVVTVSAYPNTAESIDIFPPALTVDDSVPEKARAYLSQAIDSLHAPAGCIMLCASSVDAMLKEKSYVKGTLNQRIDLAASDHIITDEMSRWAHEVRLDANNQRHANETLLLPNEKDAKRTIEFTLALAQFLFVLPSRVSRGLADTTAKVSL